MSKYVLSVLGCDRPGIVARVSRILSRHQCNIEDLTQTVLQTEFAAIFIFTSTEDPGENLLKNLKADLEPQGLSVRLKIMEEPCLTRLKADTFVAVAIGPDSPGQIAALSGIMKDFNCNITSIRAINRSHLYPDKIVIIIEMDVPDQTPVDSLRSSLERTSSSLGLQFSLQHKDIFESIHRV
ncbi:MAG: glycine cleavage system protein R [Desulfonatronovibrionaceae bacterium]